MKKQNESSLLNQNNIPHEHQQPSMIANTIYVEVAAAS